MTNIKKILAFFVLVTLFLYCWDHEKKLTLTEQTYSAYRPFFSYVEQTSKNYQKLTILEKLDLRQDILKQSKTLAEQGWQVEPIKQVYLSQLDSGKMTAQDMKTYLKTRVTDMQTIASSAFMQMWQKQEKYRTEEEAKQALNIILSYLDMPDELDGSQKEIKSLLASFDSQLAPTDDFWAQIASLVQTAYPGESLSNDDALSKQIHQLRYVISAQQAQWVREHYRTKRGSDAAALAKYLTELNPEDYSLTESSRYHNKVARGFDSEGNLIPVYADDVQQSNFKVLIGFHSEFILSESGQFLIEVDLEDRTYNSIINSASFNYANQNDILHEQLDINPIHIHEPEFAQSVMTSDTQKYVEPSLTEQKDKYDSIYSREGKSSKQLTKAAVKKFKKLIAKYQKAKES